MTHNIADMWGFTEEQLFEAAMVNTPRMYPKSIKRLADAMAEISAAFGDPFKEQANIPMYTVTTEEYHRSAGAILYPGVLEELKEIIGGDFYILPSSIHETIVMPTDSFTDEYCTEMVRKVNQVALEPNERLSNSAYRYVHGKGIVLAESGEENGD